MPATHASSTHRSMQLAVLVLATALLLQLAFWRFSHNVEPEMEIVPSVPGEQTVRALSFGDEEAYFRLHALGIQTAGDTFGRFTALYKYDYAKLYRWFLLLDTLNRESDYLPTMAAYYYSQSQNVGDVNTMVDYLDGYTEGRAKEKWWWVVQAVYLAQHKMGDLDRAQSLANRLQGVRGIPVWAQQLPAFIYEKRGEFGDALAIIEAIAKHPEDYSQGELNFMRYFVDERLGRLDQVKKEFDEIQRIKDAEKAKGMKDPAPIKPPIEIQGPR